MTETPPKPSPYDRDPEALAWARAKVQAYIDQLARWQEEANERGAAAKGLAFGSARILAQRHFLGNGGCVIGAFDERRPAVTQGTEDALPPGTKMTLTITGTPEQAKAAGEQVGRALRRTRFGEEGL